MPRLATAQLSLAAASMVARPARLGGEWAGWCCTYGSETGMLRRVDEKYLSATELEWGQVPAGFEECTTETWEEGDALVRRSVRLLPETGCAVDNLAAEVSRVTLPTLSEAPDSRASAIDAIAEPGVWRCESVFCGLGGPRPRDWRGAIECPAERTRVALTFDTQRGALAGSVDIWQERRWSETPSLQVREDRGSRSGLDASWVFSAVGLWCFGEDEAAAAERAAAAAGQAVTVGQLPLLLALPGGVEFRGEAGRLEVALCDAEGKAAVCLRRAWADGEVSIEVE